jgi:DNA polymerase
VIEITADFETANQGDCDLPTVGAWAYAEHPMTEVLCLVLTDGLGQHLYTWFPGQSIDYLLLLAGRDDIMWVSHNAQFEQAIWMKIMEPLGLPRIPIKQWKCTLAVCAYKVLPLKLERAAQVLGLAEQKDTEGRKLTLSLSKPMTQVAWMAEKSPWITQAEHKRQYEPIYDRRPATLARVAAYCLQDDVTEAALHRVIGDLSPYERQVWELDQVINQRGLRIDVPYVHACQRVVAGATVPMQRRFAAITGGLSTGQVEKIMGWCHENGFKLPNLQKPTLKSYGIGIDDEDDDDDEAAVSADRLLPMPANVREALSIRAMLGSASIKKLPRMLACLSSDGRVRGALQYHAAGPGRWGGRLFQPHNFPRAGAEVIDIIKGKETAGPPRSEDLKAALMTGDAGYVSALYGDPILAVAGGLRHALIPADGHVYRSGDYSQIEARMVLALAGQHDKCEVFAKRGSGIYLDMAEAIYKRPAGSLDKHNDIAEYTIGKNTILGCGFQMGAATFRNRYCPLQTEAFAKGVIKTYRTDFAPEVPKLWAGLQEAALMAVYDGQPHDAYGVTYSRVDRWLTARLPDGQMLWYFDPQLVKRAMPWDATDIRLGWTYKAIKSNAWKTIHAYGGLLTENVVQALARGLLCEAMFRLEANGYPLVLTVHDEALGEPKRAQGDQKAFEQIMAERSAWARAIGVPVAVEGWEGDCYRK